MTEPRRTRRGARSSRSKTVDILAKQPPFEQPRMRFDPLRAVSEDELEAIHHASLRVLAETGIDFLDETARQQLAEAGAEIDGNRVRFSPELVMQLMTTVPEQFTLRGIRPERNLQMGGNAIAVTSVASPPFVTGLGRDRRDGNREDYRNLIKMSQV
ncbi:MAG: methyltransferase, partial [Actinobacteria bacterium]|nr:methyltransferase [Actinomycetota bacterium]